MFCFVFCFSKSRKNKKDKKESRKNKKGLQKIWSIDCEEVDESSLDKDQIKSKDKFEDDNEVSSEGDVDISRGEGDIYSSSDEEDEQKVQLQIEQVCTFTHKL